MGTLCLLYIHWLWDVPNHLVNMIATSFTYLVKKLIHIRYNCSVPYKKTIVCYFWDTRTMVAISTKDSVLGASLVLSVVSLVLLFSVTWYFQSSLSLLQQQVNNDRELLVKLQEKLEVRYQLGTISEHIFLKGIYHTDLSCYTTWLLWFAICFSIKLKFFIDQ